MNAKPENTLAFIPCRTTSKRLPGKNMMELAGRKLVFRAIDFALHMGFKTVVAPDTEEALHILSQEYGDKITLFLRDADMADGNHQLESWAAAHESMELVWTGDGIREDGTPESDFDYHQYAYGIMLEPSSPLRHERDIQACLSALSHLHAIGTVTRGERLRAEKLQLADQGGMWRGSLDGRINWPGALDDIVQFNGVCYAARRETILNQTLWDHMGTHVVEGVSFNIDTIDDFKVAEAYIMLREAGGPCWPGV
jgi:CMP-N,N'-diacetyllegionaminic acid synthase